jgi:hypothetical protein
VRRLIVVAAVVAVALVALRIAAIVRSDGGGDKTVETVAGHKITEKNLELTVEHFHEEADREGKPFPAKGSKEYRRVEQIALGLLIDRTAIEAAAAKLGIHVTDSQLEARTGAPAGEEGDVNDEADAAFTRATARNAVITAAVSRKLPAGISVREAQVLAYYHEHRGLYGVTPLARVAPAIRSQLLSASKNAALSQWLAKVRSTEPEAVLG